MYAVVQVRGVVKTRQDIKDTLKMLRLHHINHCVLIQDTPENLGMIRKVKDYVAFGEVDAATVETLLQTRGRVIGDAPLTDEVHQVQLQLRQHCRIRQGACRR